MAIERKAADAPQSKRWIDRIADSAKPSLQNNNVSQRSIWWWILLMPGKVILWFEYMFPSTIISIFGTARRRNIPLIQLFYSLCFYLILLVIVPIVLIKH